MVKVFEPDEAVPLNYLFDMLKPAEDIKQSIYNFLDYNYYFYGFPYFAFSALSILPIKLMGEFESHYPETMYLLRQMISVVPIIISIYLLVGMQTKYRSKIWSVALFMLLLSVPAVIRNDFWWHPDSLVILFIVLTIHFLNKDELALGRNFLFAAVTCGFSIGIKMTGFFFFLTIAIYLLWGFFAKKNTLKRTVAMGVTFILLMVFGYLLANPLFVFRYKEYFRVFQSQTRLLRDGYEVIYDKGLQVAAPTLVNYYGSWFFLILASLAPVVGIIRNRNRLLNVIILSWAFPLTIYVLTASHFKFQYWLPVALPLFSSLTAFIPDLAALRWAGTSRSKKQIAWSVLGVLAAGIISFQFVSYLQRDIDQYQQRLHRAKDSPSINFYQEAVSHLGLLPEQEVYVYHDVRLYVPDTSPWKKFSVFHLLSYEFFEETNPGIILLMQQRIRDYLNPDVEGINPEELEISREFYDDADQGQIRGYLLVYRNDFGLCFVREDIFQEYLNQ
jgi:hypothetical protein